MKLVKILPNKIQIRTDDTEFKNARLNDLISVSDGEVVKISEEGKISHAHGLAGSI